MTTPKRYCIPGICTAISANNTKAITAAKGKAYFIDHSFAYDPFQFEKGNERLGRREILDCPYPDDLIQMWGEVYGLGAAEKEFQYLGQGLTYIGTDGIGYLIARLFEEC
jgi:hypothetical protein